VTACRMYCVLFFHPVHTMLQPAITGPTVLEVRSSCSHHAHARIMRTQHCRHVVRNRTAATRCSALRSSVVRSAAIIVLHKNLHPTHVIPSPVSSAHPRTAICLLLLLWTLGYIGCWCGFSPSILFNFYQGLF
jgi:hypothetical protein